jgi:oligoribonuclease
MTRKYCPCCATPLQGSEDTCALFLCTCAACGWAGQWPDTLKEPHLPIPIPKMRYISIDIETTGLDPDTCQTLEIGAVAEDWVTPIDRLPRFRRVLLYDRIIGNPFALALNASLLKQIAAAPKDDSIFCKPDELGQQFAEWINSCGLDPLHLQPAGKNFASFDAQFMKRLPNFYEHVQFRHRTLDPAILFWRPAEDEKLPDTKTCMERANIPGEVAHTAVEDALVVVKMIRCGVRSLTGL